MKSPETVIDVIQKELRAQKDKHGEAVENVRELKHEYQRALTDEAAKAQEMKELAQFLDDNIENGGYVELVDSWIRNVWDEE